MLCPKKGGAMKPTNLFTSYENFRKYNSGSGQNKKSTKKGTLIHSMSEQLNYVDGLNIDRKI